MAYIATTATKKIAALRKRIRAIPGGSSAGKTIAVIQCLIDLAQTDEKATVTSVVSESVPHLKTASIRDFQEIMKQHGYWKDAKWNATDRIYRFETGSMMEFFSADNGDKCRGPRRDRLFINEANHVSFEAFNQLEIRTNEFIVLDWNPSEEFWYYTELKGKRDDIEELTLTYLDNEACPQLIRESIERRKNNERWFKVYGLGQLGDIEGRIYKDWQIIDSVPHEARLERRGLDFGFTNDPTAIVDIYWHNGGWVMDEIIYRNGMKNREIADFLKQQPEVLTIADSAEPKSIDEIEGYGVRLLPAGKGPGSVKQGISYVQDQRISVTRRSVNLIREYRNYMWLSDRNGKFLNEPEDGTDHCLDAIRYGLDGKWKDSTDNRIGEERLFLRKYYETD